MCFFIPSRLFQLQSRLYPSLSAAAPVATDLNLLDTDYALIMDWTDAFGDAAEQRGPRRPTPPRATPSRPLTPRSSTPTSLLSKSSTSSRMMKSIMGEQRRSQHVTPSKGPTEDGVVKAGSAEQYADAQPRSTFLNRSHGLNDHQTASKRAQSPFTPPGNSKSGAQALPQSTPGSFPGDSSKSPPASPPLPDAPPPPPVFDLPDVNAIPSTSRLGILSNRNAASSRAGSGSFGAFNAEGTPLKSSMVASDHLPRHQSQSQPDINPHETSSSGWIRRPILQSNIPGTSSRTVSGLYPSFNASNNSPRPQEVAQGAPPQWQSRSHPGLNPQVPIDASSPSISHTPLPASSATVDPTEEVKEMAEKSFHVPDFVPFRCKVCKWPTVKSEESAQVEEVCTNCGKIDTKASTSRHNANTRSCIRDSRREHDSGYEQGDSFGIRGATCTTDPPNQRRPVAQQSGNQPSVTLDLPKQTTTAFLPRLTSWFAAGLNPSSVFKRLFVALLLIFLYAGIALAVAMSPPKVATDTAVQALFEQATTQVQRLSGWRDLIYRRQVIAVNGICELDVLQCGLLVDPRSSAVFTKIADRRNAKLFHPRCPEFKCNGRPARDKLEWEESASSWIQNMTDTLLAMNEQYVRLGEGVKPYMENSSKGLERMRRIAMQPDSLYRAKVISNHSLPLFLRPARLLLRTAHDTMISLRLVNPPQHTLWRIEQAKVVALIKNQSFYTEFQRSMEDLDRECQHHIDHPPAEMTTQQPISGPLRQTLTKACELASMDGVYDIVLRKTLYERLRILAREDGFVLPDVVPDLA